MHRWDPERYLTYADERGRPFVELVARIGATDPRRVVDLGCGPGNLTALLAERWPDARVEGLDSSPEMIERATTTVATAANPDSSVSPRSDSHGRPQTNRGGPAVEFRVADLRDWASSTGPTGAAQPVDVLVSNATLQWIPGHLDLLPGLVAAVARGGWLAFQVPGNFDEPSHTIRTELADEPAYAEHTRGVAVPSSHDPAVYLDALVRLGCDVDAWETTYLHVLTGEDPVFTWVSGTGARPTLQALPDDLRAPFETEFKSRLRAAYPPGPAGVVLPFRRIFVVAQVPGRVA